MKSNTDKISQDHPTENNKKEGSIILTTSIIFDEEIEEIWDYLKNLENEIQIISFLSELKYIKGNNTWIVGNEFSIYWTYITHFKVTVINTKEENSRKEIKWFFEGDIGISYFKTLILNKITNSLQTFVENNFSSSNTSEKNGDFTQSLNYYKKIHEEILYKLKENFKNWHLGKDICLYKSCTLEQNPNKLFNFLKCYNLMSKYIPFEFKLMENNGKSNVYIKHFNQEINKTNYYIIDDSDTPEKKNSLTFRLKSLESKNENISKLIEFKVTKINDNKSQLSILSIFFPDTNPAFIESINKIHTDILNNLNKYIESNEKEFLSITELIQTK